MLAGGGVHFAWDLHKEGVVLACCLADAPAAVVHGQEWWSIKQGADGGVSLRLWLH